MLQKKWRASIVKTLKEFSMNFIQDWNKQRDIRVPEWEGVIS